MVAVATAVWRGGGEASLALHRGPFWVAAVASLLTSPVTVVWVSMLAPLGLLTAVALRRWRGAWIFAGLAAGTLPYWALAVVSIVA